MKIQKKKIQKTKTNSVLATTFDALRALDIPTKLKRAIRDGLRVNEAIIMPTLGTLPYPHIAVARNPDWQSAYEIRRSFGKLAMLVQAARHESLHAFVDARRKGSAAGAAAQGLCQGGYRFDRYLSTKTNVLKSISIDAALTAKDIKEQQIIADAIACSRDLINTPAEDMGPDQFVAAAKSYLRGSGVRVRVMDAAACKRAGMGALLAVGRASHRKPRLLILEAGPKRKSFQALCGKGVCFDTGGLGIKSSKGMLLMRKDMGGAASVLAAVGAAARLGLKKSIRAYLPLVENSIDGNAFRPGDILTAMDGTTIEVGHTDAEGRLVLADAMCQARKEGAASICTVATLTGAAMVALGRIHVPIMGDDDKQIESIEDAAQHIGEKVWRLPLDEEHRRLMATPHADINNSGNGEAGCITAGAFLQHFAGDVPFAHCDISPCSWQMKDHNLGQVGATGAFVHTLIEAYS